MSWVDTVKVKLERPWGPHAAGTVIEVDPTRAGTLDELGYLEKPEPQKPKRKGRG